jgi:peptidoglycan/LPS O-acetylase OafA/YrhL
MHLRPLVFMHFDADRNTSLFAKLFFFLHGFGHEAVMIFFVLSGYLVGGEVLRHLHRGSFNAETYTLRRVTRLYPVYLAALVLGCVLDHLGLQFFTDTGLYTVTGDLPMVSADVASRLHFGTLIGNLVFCQRLLVPTYGSNAPLWSLANEAWYYLMFPLLAVPLFIRLPAVRTASALVLLAGAAWFVRGDMLIYFAVWMLGVLVHFPRRAYFRQAWPALLAMAAIMILLRLHRLDGMPGVYADLGIGATFAMALLSLSFAPNGGFPLAALHRRMAGFSYSVYVVHWPLALFLLALCQHFAGFGLRGPLSAGNLCFYLGLLLLVYGSAWTVAGVTEHRTAAIRAWTAKQLGLRNSAP